MTPARDAVLAPEARPLVARAPGKSEAAFRTISEVADELDVAQHVLRFWESKFPQIRPLKRGGGRRYYRPEDIELLRQIRSLLYEQGYTIKGAQKSLRERRGKLADAGAAPGSPSSAEPRLARSSPSRAQVLSPATRTRLARLRGELVTVRDELRRALDQS
jgi:DNA-binding transcriptional MerR regulator